MKRSSYVFAALVGFALINTAFLGAHVLSSQTSELGPFNTATAVSSLTSTVPTLTVSSPSSTTTEASAVTTTTETTTTASLVTGTVTSSQSSLSTSAQGPPQTTSVTTTPVAALNANNSYSFAGSSGYLASLSTATWLTVVVRFFEDHSLALAPSSWIAVGGMWIWRGRMRSRWTDLGFDSDVFGLFVKMKGGKTRMRLLDALSLPKDRLQLAQELGLDWKGVDRHLFLMKKYGFVTDRVAYGKVRMYELTPMGNSLLKLLQELSREETRESVPGPRLYEN